MYEAQQWTLPCALLHVSLSASKGVVDIERHQKIYIFYTGRVYTWHLFGRNKLTFTDYLTNESVRLFI